MIGIRPVERNDLAALMELAQLTGFGLTTLPRDQDLLRERVLESEHAFARNAFKPRGETYLFVMFDASNGRVAGTCGIASKTGGYEPFYAYRIETSVHQSDMLKVRKEIRTLHLVTEHNGPCEIGSLFLHPEYRKSAGAGRLLSLCRFLFMAEHRQRFDTMVIAEMRGVVDEQGRSPFWDAVGKHFFEIDFPKADYLSMINKKFIADLMPKHPLYIPLLPPEAQAVIGQVHPDTRPALKLLESEGFAFSGMVDIFEAGPVVIAPLDSVRTIRESKKVVVAEIVENMGDDESHMMHILNPATSRMCRTTLEITAAGARIGKQAAEVLQLKIGEAIRHAAPRAGGYSAAQMFQI